MTVLVLVDGTRVPVDMTVLSNSVVDPDPVANVDDALPPVTDETKLTRPVLLLVNVAPLAIVTAPPNDMMDEPARSCEVLKVVVPAPLVNVAPFIVIPPPNTDAVLNAERSNDPPGLIVTSPVNVLVPVPEVTARAPSIVVVPANVIATPPRDSVPEGTSRLPNVYAPVIEDVPVATSVLVAFADIVAFAGMAPVRLSVLFAPSVRKLTEEIPTKFTPAPAVSVPLSNDTLIVPPPLTPPQVMSPPDESVQSFIDRLILAVIPEFAPCKLIAPLVANVPVAPDAQVMLDCPALVVGRLIVSDPAVMLAVPFMVMVCVLAVALAV